MKGLAALLQEVFADHGPLVIVGLADASLAASAKLSSIAELRAGEQFGGALWAGPLSDAPAAAKALGAAVTAGGAVVLAQVRGRGPLAVVRTWVSANAERRNDTVERLCGALLCAGLARPALLVESPALTAAVARVRAGVASASA
jgi:hypothetical protein